MTTIQLGEKDFLTADTHLGGAPWPYKLWFQKGKGDPKDQLRESLARTWDYQAGKDSTIVVVGDALDLRAEDVERELLWFDMRPGKKILIPGNNDLCHPMNKKDPLELEAQGWTDVFEVMEPRSTMLAIGTLVLPACHYPNSEKPQASWRHENTHGALPVLHGHTHARRPVSRTADGRLQLNVGWPAWRKLAPVPAILELLEQPWQDSVPV